MPELRSLLRMTPRAVTLAAKDRLTLPEPPSANRWLGAAVTAWPKMTRFVTDDPLVSAYLAWHLERGLKSLSHVER
mgnify:CR=1 FL=1